MKNKVLASLLSVLLVASLVTGCGSKETTTVEETTVATEAAVEETTVEEVETETESETEVVDISEALVGVWVDEEANVFGFDSDNTFYAGSTTTDDEVEGTYALATDGDNTVLALLVDETETTYYVEADVENNALILTDTETGTVSAFVPYEEETTTEDGEVVDISEALVGVWVDEEANVFGFDADNTFYAGSTTTDDEVEGTYALATDGEYTVLALLVDDVETDYYVEADVENNVLMLTDVETGDVSAFAPYEE